MFQTEIKRENQNTFCVQELSLKNLAVYEMVWEHVACRDDVGTRGLSSTTLFFHITSKTA
jgi:hypothetical protein